MVGSTNLDINSCNITKILEILLRSNLELGVKNARPRYWQDIKINRHRYRLCY